MSAELTELGAARGRLRRTLARTDGRGPRGLPGNPVRPHH